MLLVCQTALSFPHDDKRVNSISPFAHYKYFLPASHELGAPMNPIHLLHPGASSAFYYNSRNNFWVRFCLPQFPGRNKHVLPHLRPVSSCWVATGDGNCYSKGDLQWSCFYFKQIDVCVLGVVRRFWYVICNPVLSSGFVTTDKWMSSSLFPPWCKWQYHGLVLVGCTVKSLSSPDLKENN